MSSLTRLAEIQHDERLSDLIDRLFLGLLTFEGRNKKWVTWVDSNQYLWFSEVPNDGAKKDRILNGHIYTVLAIAEYYDKTENPDALALLKAGLTTIQRYVPEFRYPGRPNRYDFYGRDFVEDTYYHWPDYAPFRTVAQQLSLYHLTGDPIFRKYYEDFAVDMPFRSEWLPRD